MNGGNGGSGQDSPPFDNSNGNTSSNPFSNIGTPSFNLSQIPRNVLQNLTPAQVQMIQQRHRQLLMSRFQQQQVQNRQQSLNTQGQQQPLQQAQMQEQARAQAQARAMAQAQAQSQASRQSASQQQRRQTPGMTVNQQLDSRASGMPSVPIDQAPSNASGQQAGIQPQAVRNVPPPQAPINLPPQIARLPPPMQQQVLNTLKQQAIAKNNPAVVAAITMAQQHLQQQLQQQDQPHGSPIPPSGESPMNAQVPVAQNVPVQRGVSPQVPQPHVTVPPQHINPSQPSPQQQAMGVPNNLMSVPRMPNFDLPKYQTINFDPPETKLPYPTYWSDQGKTTDNLLYEQIIQRDKANKSDLMKETNGYEPFSIYGFSNKEYLGKLWHTLKYYQELKATRMKSITNTSQNIPSASIWGNGYSGYGNGVTNSVRQVIAENPIDGRKHVYLDRLKVYEQAMNEKNEELVPIRLEFDYERDRFFLRDTLLWNKNDNLLRIEDFVDDLMRDYRYAPLLRDQFNETICQSMREQISEFQSNPYLDLDEERTGGDDMRIMIKIDIVVGQHQLLDNFEWDISNPENCPEEFAESLCRELSLPGEFATAVAHSIREQVHMYHRTLALLGHNFDGSVIDDDEVRSRMLPIITVDDVYRAPSDAKSYTPNLFQISAAELERLDKDKDRDTRRKRRQGRLGRRGVAVLNGSNNNLTNTQASTGGSNVGATSGQGAAVEVSLPDIADVPRTFRTPIPSTVLPGGIDLGPPVGSYDLKTTTERKPRPVLPIGNAAPCQVIDHIPGSSLLLCIKLNKKEKVHPGEEEKEVALQQINAPQVDL